MVDDALAVPARIVVEWFEETIPVRGCVLSLDKIREVYRELSVVNRRFGEAIIATLEREPDLSDQEWQARKEFLLNDAFCLTVSIRGERDQRLYGESTDIFTSENLPKPITSIYFNNVTAWKRHANGTEPSSLIEVNLDFNKPALLDPNPLVSEATPNQSSVTVKAHDMTYFRAVQQVVDSKLRAKKTWYGGLHHKFTYDVGMWLIAFPIGLFLSTYYIDKWLPTNGALASYRWAFFIYAVGLCLIAYRFLNSYVKWAFPVNILQDNQDTAWKHRATLGACLMWIFYKVVDAAYELIITSVA